MLHSEKYPHDASMRFLMETLWGEVFNDVKQARDELATQVTAVDQTGLDEGEAESVHHCQHQCTSK